MQIEEAVAAMRAQLTECQTSLKAREADLKAEKARGIQLQAAITQRDADVLELNTMILQYEKGKCAVLAANPSHAR